MVASRYGVLTDVVELLKHTHPDWRCYMPDCSSEDVCRIVTFANPHSVFLGERDFKYIKNLKNFDAIYADGILLARLASRVVGRVIPRISFDGNSIAGDVFRYCAERKLKVGIVGGVDGVAFKAAEVFSRKFGVNVTYTRNGFFSSESEMVRCATQLDHACVNLVICGMGAPHQEKFLIALKESGWKGTGFSCGGYLDQAIKSDAKYYPVWVNRYNLRAAYRLIKEPRRLGRRYLMEYFPFYKAAFKLINYSGINKQ